MLPHETPERVEEALKSHSGGLTSADEEAAVNALLAGGEIKAQPAAPQPAYGVPVMPQASSIPLQPMGQHHQQQPHLQPMGHQQQSHPQSHHPTFPSTPNPNPPYMPQPPSASRPPANLPPTQALSVNAAPPRLSGRRKALLIGVNYDGTPAQLRGCVNDVAALNALLTQKYGWPRENVHALTDDGRRGPAGHPTRANIVSAMRWLAQDAAPGDILFLAFSGHGAQKPDTRGIEEDGMNETILPVDWQTVGMRNWPP